jgi:hypothetical protein
MEGIRNIKKELWIDGYRVQDEYESSTILSSEK